MGLPECSFHDSSFPLPSLSRFVFVSFQCSPTLAPLGRLPLCLDGFNVLALCD